MLIGLTGKKQSGKDTAADYLVQYRGFTKLAFATKLKEMLYDINPVVNADVVFDGMTKVVDTRFVYLQEVVDAYGWDRAKVLCPEVRRMLQRVGTDGVRNHIGKWTWVAKIEDELMPMLRKDPRRNVVFSDVRLPEEREFVHAQGGIILRIELDSQRDDESENGKHESEAGVAYDHLIQNFDGLPEAMFSQLDEVVKKYA